MAIVGLASAVLLVTSIVIDPRSVAAWGVVPRLVGLAGLALLATPFLLLLARWDPVPTISSAGGAITGGLLVLLWTLYMNTHLARCGAATNVLFTIFVVAAGAGWLTVTRTLERPGSLVAAKTTLALAATIAPLAVVEFALRVTEEDVEPVRTREVNHPVLGFHRRPSFVITHSSRADGYANRFTSDDRGLLLRPHPGNPAHSPRALRVLLLGDSQAEGYQVAAADNLSVTLERELASTLGQPVEVTNTGQSGFSPAQYLLGYRVWKQRVAPDIVVALLFVGNDITDDARLFRAGRMVFDGEGELARILPRFDPGRGVQWQTETGITPLPWLQAPRAWQLRILGVGSLRWGRLRSDLHARVAGNTPPAWPAPRPDPRTGAWGRLSDFGSLERTPLAINIFSALKSDYSDEDRADLQRSLGFVARLHRETVADNRSFLLVIHAERSQVPGQAPDNAAAIGYPGTPLPDQPQRTIAVFCERHGIPYYDDLPLLRAHATKRLYWPIDFHINATAHAIIGRQLAAELRTLPRRSAGDHS
ncbi:MAG: hypothetical protein KBD01_16355 [Acidobacteria bacterium]|nr:hypothetical protein [Acidobacteriota bacterium]